MKELSIDILVSGYGGKLADLTRKILDHQRISLEEGLVLFNEADLSLTLSLANHIRTRKNQQIAWYNRNIHVEPTNLCVRQCKFCSYYRKEGEEGAWNLSADEIIARIAEHPDITEVHITGGLHPDKNLDWYCKLVARIRNQFPQLHIKALTAEELDYLFRKARVLPEAGLQQLKAAGLGSLPGGGAEIFHPVIREQVCPEKITGKQWLDMHELAHKAGIFSNATMLFGHIEKPVHRLDHMLHLRELQDRTGGFNAFIPLMYRSSHNELSSRGETGFTDVMRTYAVARIFLDNFTHIKAYWPMLGKEKASLLLSFGADDLDGTIHDSTRIYSMAGAEEKSPHMDSHQIRDLILQSGFQPVERNSLYQALHEKPE
ncbi:MAG: CofH family radical SAM protein [Bacteroidales bacterium]